MADTPAPDPSTRDDKTPPPAGAQRKGYSPTAVWRNTVTQDARIMQQAMIVIGFVVVAAGAVLVLVGSATQTGGYSEPDVTYDLRTPGIILIALGLLLAPIGWTVARLAEAWGRAHTDD